MQQAQPVSAATVREEEPRVSQREEPEVLGSLRKWEGNAPLHFCLPADVSISEDTRLPVGGLQPGGSGMGAWGWLQPADPGSVSASDSTLMAFLTDTH